MTEVPEHLLRRSRERKAQSAGSESKAEGEAPATDTAAKSSAVEPAAASATTAAAGGGAPAKPAAPAYTGPPQPPEPKRRIPVWAMPVVAALPFWAMLYSGAFGERTVAAEGPVAAGAAIYSGQGCGGCHGPSGAGGVGPAMGDVVEVFPNFADHVAWVRNGSAPVKGQNYGEGGRGNGGNPATGGMPGFDLPEEDLIAVVCHERVTLAGQDPPPPECEEGASPDAGEGTGAGAETPDEGGEGDAGVTAGGEGGG